MSRRDRKDLATLRSTVEKQSGALRSLSIAMHLHSENAAFLTRGERRIVASWADAIQEIANELTQAMADDDPGRITRVKRAAHALVVPLAFAAGSITTGAAEGVSGVVAEAWLTEEIAACASEAHSTIGEIDDEELAEENTQPSGRSPMQLHDALRTWRAVTRSRQRDLADRLNVSASTWVRWESGARRPSAASLQALFEEIDSEAKAAQRREPIAGVNEDWRSSDDYLEAVEQVRATLLEEMYQRNMPPPFEHLLQEESDRG